MGSTVSAILAQTVPGKWGVSAGHEVGSHTLVMPCIKIAKHRLLLPYLALTCDFVEVGPVYCLIVRFARSQAPRNLLTLLFSCKAMNTVAVAETSRQPKQWREPCVQERFTVHLGRKVSS